MKKTLVALMLVGVLLFGLMSSAFAASFSFHFKPPYSECAKKTSSVAAGGDAYVDPNGSTGAIVKTMFDLRYNGKEVSDTAITSGEQKFFSYYSGYGGAGQPYYMYGAPYNTDFQEYTAAGSWHP